MILSVCNTKGGSSKTTTAAYLAHALVEQDVKVLVIDADPQGSITRWAEMADWTIPVRGMASTRLHVQDVGVELEARGHDAVIIDTPGTDERRAIVESAVRASTHVLVPVAPTSIEIERMASVKELIDDVAHMGRHTAPPASLALLTRTIPNAVATTEYRELLTEEGWHVLRSTVARREVYAQAFGGPIERATATAYGDALEELLGVKTP
ncbi:ParA family protein [Pseudonocardia sp. NPDC049154]|uniref:ParA family protein n=1 Tax=Pseudonocardia sp. NPDC049154 TaxID=3155501 RepID=UPI0033C272E9